MKKPKAHRGNALLDIEGISPGAAKRITDATRALREVVEEVMPDATFEEHEAIVLKITNEIARQELERKLQTISDSLSPRLNIDHNHDWHGDREESAFDYRRDHEDWQSYHSLVGDLRVRRGVYQECGSWSRYVALDLSVGIMERTTPALAKALTLSYGEMPTRQIAAFFAASERAVPSRSTLDRIGRDLGAYAVAANDEIEATIRSEEKVPNNAKAIVLGLDRTAVAMRNNANRNSWQFTDSDLRWSRPKCPRTKDKGVNWLMDYVATVTFVDDTGEKILSRCYRLQSLANPDFIMKRVVADVQHALAQRPNLKISVVQDGAPELWKSMRKHLAAIPLVRSWHEVIDWYHVDERLALCAKLCADDESMQTAFRERWRAMLWLPNHGAARLIRALRDQCRRVGTAARDALLQHIGYFSPRRKQLCYHAMRRRKLPIGSGITEGACKSFIGTRAKRSGQHWSPRGLAASLHIRGMIQSDRFDAFWTAFRGRYLATSITPGA
jgi:hypothetical protein